MNDFLQKLVYPTLVAIVLAGATWAVNMHARMTLVEWRLNYQFGELSK